MRDPLKCESCPFAQLLKSTIEMTNKIGTYENLKVEVKINTINVKYESRVWLN